MKIEKQPHGGVLKVLEKERRQTLTADLKSSRPNLLNTDINYQR
jgi:hypothetical protein